MSRWGAVAVGVLCALAVLAGPVTSYDIAAMGVTSTALPLVACVVALRSRRHPGAPRALLGATALSAGLMAAAYLGFHAQWALTGLPSAPTVVEPLYVASYTTVLLGWLVHLRRHGTRSRTETLDAALVVVGPAAVVAALVVEPLFSGSAPERLVLAYYPLVDLAVLAVLARAVFAGLLHGPRAVLWLGATCFMLVGDAVFFVLVQTAGAAVADWYQAPYAVSLTCLVFAVAGRHDQPVAVSTGTGRGANARLALISASSCLPATVLVLQGLLGYTVDWLVLGTAAVLSAVLAASRLHAALRTSRAQAAALEQLARYDDLTRLLNRRELTLALQSAVEVPGAQVVVAFLDLDHFKRVNDAGGHAAGDLLLQDATRRWQAQLPSGAGLYRWGGEEFVVLLRDTTADDAVALLERVRTATPAPHTVSIGVAARRPGELGAGLLVRADEQLYRAKSTGRDRLCGDGVPAVPVAPVLPAVPGQRLADALPSRATSAG